MRLLVTGGCGFIGSNFLHYWAKRYPEDRLINFDLLTYAGNLENVAALVAHPTYHFSKGDICDPEAVELAFSMGVDAVVHFAAESHVDRSLLDASQFVRTNVLGTHQLLVSALRSKVKRFLLVSTDEVYGSLGAEGKFTESTPLAPRSPYAASKAAADVLAQSYHHSFGFPLLITRCCNNYGPYQFPEKLIPLMILNAMENKPLPVYGDGMQVRDWIHVEDHCRALDIVLREGKVGEVYNVGSDCERPNIELVQLLLDLLGKPQTLIRHVEDRPGHDRRYAIDATKLRRELGWKPTIKLDEGLAATIQWYKDNHEWWEKIRSGEYQKYYETQYGHRLGEQ
ncbi:MAG: dTDP-glucose 4,6-dehydratase [bacterium]